MAGTNRLSGLRSAMAGALALGLLTGGPAAAATPPVAVLDSGRIAGEAAGPISVFRGVPYAAPPVGPLRWRPTRPAAPWSDTRPATAFGPACPQAGPAGEKDIVRYGGAPEPTSEDCLTLNVWAPAQPKAASPVMVWLHGGSGRMGSGSLPYYDGAAFARDGVVLVTVNFRLGHLGGFAHPALTREADGKTPLAAFALMDQIEALRWVQRNIAAFGGDPGNVTIFGESSGAISVLTLTVTPAAQGLFHKAIVESGGGWYPPSASLKKAEEGGRDLATAAGAPADATAAQLRAIPARTLTATAGGSPAFADRRLLPEDQTIAVDAGRHAAVPLMIGVNSGEDSLLDYGGGMARAMASVKPGKIAALRKLYGPGTDDELAVRYQLRDGLVTAPARWVAGRWSRRAPAYLYFFDHVDEADRGRKTRASHGAEIFYVFQTLGLQPADPPAPGASDARLAAEMHARWVAFAKTGAPNVEGAAPWPAYSRRDDPWMVFGPDGSAVKPKLLKPQLDYQERRITPLIFLLRIKTEVMRLFGR